MHCSCTVGPQAPPLALNARVALTLQDMEGNDSDLGTNSCLIFNTLQFKIVAVIGASSALVSFFACLIVIVLIFLLKKHLFFTQRLILYLTISALFWSVALVLRRVDYVTENSATRGFCIFSGFLDQTGSWSLLLAITCITVNLFINSVLNKRTDKFEKLYIFTIFIFPLTFTWIPFINLAYGRSGAWCWIRNVDEDCNNFLFGTILQFALWWVPLYIILLVLIVLYIIIICTVQKSRRKWSGQYDAETDRLQKQLRKEIWPIFWYPVLYLLLNIFPLINRIYNLFVNQPSLALWILHALSVTLQGGFIAVAFTLDPGTLRRLSFTKLRAALRYNENAAKDYPLGNLTVQSDSFRRSGRKKQQGDEIVENEIAGDEICEHGNEDTDL